MNTASPPGNGTERPAISLPRMRRLIVSPGLTGFYADDQQAIKAGAAMDGFFYSGKPLTPGFRAVRQAGESLSLLIELEDGQWACGDAAAVQYAGAGGRDPVFEARAQADVAVRFVEPLLAGRAPDSFRALAEDIEALRVEGRPLHTALRYGLSQALLDAVARARREMPCDTLLREYGLPRVARPVKLFAQSGDDRYTHADKMILKRVDVLPHALINNIPDKLGADGERLLEYLTWLSRRIVERRADPSYAPDLHIDVYGTIGIAFHHDLDRMGAYLARLADAARPFALRIEGPVDLGSRDAQIEGLARLRGWLRERGVPVGLVADEWCNTTTDADAFMDAGAVDMIQVKTPVLGSLHHAVEAVLACRRRGVGAYLGGTCNETDVSARLCVHAALAARPDQMLAKPGMGVDEGLLIVYNEMRRVLAVWGAQPA